MVTRPPAKAGGAALATLFGTNGVSSAAPLPISAAASGATPAAARTPDGVAGKCLAAAGDQNPGKARRSTVRSTPSAATEDGV